MWRVAKVEPRQDGRLPPPGDFGGPPRDGPGSPGDTLKSAFGVPAAAQTLA